MIIYSEQCFFLVCSCLCISSSSPSSSSLSPSNILSSLWFWDLYSFYKQFWVIRLDELHLNLHLANVLSNYIPKVLHSFAHFLLGVHRQSPVFLLVFQLLQLIFIVVVDLLALLVEAGTMETSKMWDKYHKLFFLGCYDSLD